MKLETPYSYNTQITLPNNIVIIYNGLYEICQGCPEVGRLSINGKFILKEVFCGPLLYHDNYIYVPCFRRKWFNSGFYLAKINIDTLEISIISKMYPLIDLIKIENDMIYFYTDMQQNNIGEVII